MQIDGETAWQQALSNKAGRWRQIQDRFRSDIMAVTHRPKFSLTAADKFFCIGSCFARNIEEHLIYRNIDVLSKAIVCPREEWPARPNGIVNKFTTASMLNELTWVDASPAIETILMEGERGWHDPHLQPHTPAVPLARAVERRRYLQTEYFSRVRQASVIILTLGLIEAWFDNQVKSYLNYAPSPWHVKRYGGRFVFEELGFDANVAALHDIHARVKKLSPAAKIIVTVSPVPLEVTFSGAGIILANTHSKSVLRAAAQVFAASYDDVDYFPSYEMVMASRRDVAFESRDHRHVNDAMVSAVGDYFVASYIGYIERRFPDFVEVEYLRQNPIVEDAVRRGELTSGYHHWLENIA